MDNKNERTVLHCDPLPPHVSRSRPPFSVARHLLVGRVETPLMKAGNHAKSSGALSSGSAINV